MITFLRNSLQSFPVQLLLLHLRSNFLLLAMWVLLVLMINGTLGQRLGLQYLFLDPEYLGLTGYWPFLLIGMAFGFFTMSWNLSTYLLLGGYFNFLASLTRPFFKYCINNALLPLIVLLLYCAEIVAFHGNAEVAGTRVQCLSGLLIGLTLSFFIYSIYFNLTNRDISYYTGQREAPPNIGPGRRPGAQLATYRATAIGPIMANSYDNPFRVRFYLTARLLWRRVRSVAHYDAGVLRNIFRQNHTNALVLQFATVLALILLGLLIEFPAFQLPAGASFLILLSLFISIIGAVSYWFSAWRLLLLLLLLFAINFLTSTPFFEHGNQAYGLNYAVPPAEYSVAELRSIYSPDTLFADAAATMNILERWKAKQPVAKPKMVILCASGGGLTAGLWATHLGQSIEECSDGRLMRSTALMTGASGGLLGLAYLRESYLRDSAFALRNNYRIDRISTDLLNPVAFSIVSNDIFLPFRRIRVGEHYYRRDRAYAFERAFNQITDGLMDKPLIHYRAAELNADVPLMFITPSIIEDGRRMVISPQGVSYMMAPPSAAFDDLDLLPDMVDFRRLFRRQEADSIRLSTALRANASYPYVLPQVSLPSQPEIHLMDAGYRDNYGIASAVRFVKVFRKWILENTSGVVLVQISAFREHPIKDVGRRGVVSSLFSPLGVAGNILSLQILDQENLLDDLSLTLGPENFTLFRFNFQPRSEDILRTSVSLHLTDYEKIRVLREIDSPRQQARIDALIQLLNGN